MGIDISKATKVFKDEDGPFIMKPPVCFGCGDKKLNAGFLQSKTDRKRGRGKRGRVWCPACWKRKKEILDKAKAGDGK